VVEITPLSSSNGGSMHQKQPPAKVALAVCALPGAGVAKNNSAASPQHRASLISICRVLMKPPMELVCYAQHIPSTVGRKSLRAPLPAITPKPHDKFSIPPDNLPRLPKEHI
jgi:hypothetical protein